MEKSKKVSNKVADLVMPCSPFILRVAAIALDPHQKIHPHIIDEC